VSEALGPVRRETLAEQVARLLIQSIIERRLRPGDELPSETRLAEEFGVSRPVAREALRHLAALNMIQLANGKLPVVKPVTGELMGIFFDWALQLHDANFVELHELRRGVEGACAMHAARRRTDEDVATLTALLAEMRANVHDLEAYTELDMRLHLAIAAASHNRLLRHTVESIRHSMRQVIRAGLELMERTEPALEDLQRGHEGLVAPIVDGDPEEARRRMDAHLSGAVARFVAAGTPPRHG
jgi:GntR family transcriptional regulator, transcriptional repressor for pyruvate dehydrogenase complex